MDKPELQKHTLHLRAGDFDKITIHRARRGIPASMIIRRLVSAYVDRFMEAEIAGTSPAKIETEIDLD